MPKMKFDNDGQKLIKKLCYTLTAIVMLRRRTAGTIATIFLFVF